MLSGAFEIKKKKWGGGGGGGGEGFQEVGHII